MQKNSLFAFATLFLSGFSALNASEAHTFTNKKGQSIEAAILEVTAQKVAIKTSKGKTYKIPICSLSEADQTYIKDWHEKNKNLLKPSDVRLTISKKTARVREEKKKAPTPLQKKIIKKSKKRRVSYHFELRSYNPSVLAKDVTVKYRIIKKIFKRAGKSKNTSYEAIQKVIKIPLLISSGDQELSTPPVTVINSLIVETSDAGKITTEIVETIVGCEVIVYSGKREIAHDYHDDRFERIVKTLDQKYPSIKMSK